MRAFGRSAVTVLVLALLAASTALAQRPQTRQGFWIGFGFGYGSADATCTGCSGGSRQGGGAGFVKLGGTLRPNLLLGGELDAWTKSEPGNVTETIGNASAALYWYPSVAGGFFVKGGLGSSTYQIKVGNATVDKTGVGVLAGLGYDIRIGGNTSLTPVVDFFWGNQGDIPELLVQGFKTNVIHLGLGVTFH